MTLEQIKGMEIPVGTPIELTIKFYNGSGYSEKLRKRLTYFDGIGKSRVSIAEEDILKCKKDPQDKFGRRVYHFDRIEGIKILEYKD